MDILYWQRCLELRLCPEFLKFKPPNNNLYRRVEDVYEFVVKKSLFETKRELEEARRNNQQLQASIYGQITYMERIKLEHLLKRDTDKKMIDVEATHNKKLLNMWLKQRPRSPESLINLSKHKLTLEEKNVLYRGLNHHILPGKVNGDQLRVNIENLYKNAVTWKSDKNKENKVVITMDAKDEIRGLTRNFIRSAKSVCSSKTNQAFHKHLKTLSNNEDLAVMKFDKGNGVCIMDKEEYLKKLDDIINDKTKFMNIVRGKRKNAKHPLLKKQDDIKDDMKQHLKAHVDEKLWKKLRPSGTNTGKLYGTCKVHKANYPLRPIVSMVNTPVYNLAKYLDNLIKPMIPSTYCIKSNVQLMERLREFNIKPDDYCISFDVVSLFTNVPLNQTIQIVADTVYAEASICKPPMPRPSLVKLLECATGGLFSHRQQLYQQTDGVSMGNPLAPTLANYFLGYFERDLLETQQDGVPKPALYLRYVDDIICIFRKDVKFEPFLHSLNNIHPNLQFTYELGGKSLPFLDTTITLQPYSFTSTVFRKNTDTNVVMNYSSMTPKKWKVGLIKWFLHRADRVCSDKSLFSKEVDRLRDTFYKNGYPNWFFDKTIREFDDEQTRNSQPKIPSNTDASEENDSSFQHVLKVPYVGRPSILYAKRLRSVLKDVVKDKIRVVYSSTKVRDFFRIKDRDPKELQTNVVYSFRCLSDSNVQYIGYTNRALKERVKEHLSGGTRVSDHIGSCKTCSTRRITWDDFAIMKKCRRKHDTAVYEAIFIKRFNPSLNIQLIKPGYSHKLQIFN